MCTMGKGARRAEASPDPVAAVAAVVVAVAAVSILENPQNLVEK